MSREEERRRNDQAGFYLAVVLFGLALPLIIGVSFWMGAQLKDVDRTTLQLSK
ncbi:MAG: hypothetical protein NZM37_01105 [Sandaracinaceae bacterium]|nr:hypothetical protein [Sandaracinaceae bacterium]MDW8245043.1 hypothetical protein [Sandaracinaceae bacterium]